jgi:hypothetical protein
VETVLKDTILNECAKNCDDQTRVFIICDSSTIVDLSTNVVECLEWDLLICFNESLELASADDEIFICESIGNIPADGSELSAILDNSMEESEAEQKLLVGLGLGALIEVLDIESLICSQDILSESTGWLKGHFNGVLQG